MLLVTSRCMQISEMQPSHTQPHKLISHYICTISLVLLWTSTKLCVLPHSTSAFTVLSQLHGGKKRKRRNDALPPQLSMSQLYSLPTHDQDFLMASCSILCPCSARALHPSPSTVVQWFYNEHQAGELLRMSCLGFVRAHDGSFLSSSLECLLSLCLHSPFFGTICCDSQGRCHRNHKCQTQILGDSIALKKKKLQKGQMLMQYQMSHTFQPLQTQFSLEDASFQAKTCHV